MAKKQIKSYWKDHVPPQSYEGCEGIKKDSISDTIPSQALTVHELLERHVQGLTSYDDYRDGMYDTEDDVDPDEFDISERSNRTELEMLEYAFEHGRKPVGDVKSDDLSSQPGSGTNGTSGSGVKGRSEADDANETSRADGGDSSRVGVEKDSPPMDSDS